MANENLKQALQQAGLTAERFAQIIEVDPKTVQRWVSGRTPYRRHRATVARALGTTEQRLWPDIVPEPADLGDRESPDDESQPGDIVGSWGDTTQHGAPDLIPMIAGASSRVDVRHERRLLRLSDSIIQTIADRARAGCQVRVITQWLTPELTSLVGIDAIDLRVSGAVSDTCLIRSDDEMLLFLPVATADRRMPVVLHLRRRTDGGLFDRLVEQIECEQASERTTDPLTDPEQLAAYLHDDNHRTAPSEQPGPDGRAGPTPPAGGPADQDSPRRWPRRPS